MKSTKWRSFKVRHEKLLKFIRILIILFVVVFVLFLITSIIRYAVTKDNTPTPEMMTLVLPPDLCEDLTGSKPARLDREWREYFTGWGAQLSVEDGNLVITISENRLNGIMTQVQGYIDDMIKKGVKISSDYKYIEFDVNDPIDKTGTKSPWAILECARMQFYSGAAAEDIKVEVVGMDYETGEIVYQATWPELIEYEYVTDLFTIYYKLSNGNAEYRKTATPR